MLVVGYGAAFSLRARLHHDLARTRQVVWCAVAGLAILVVLSGSPAPPSRPRPARGTFSDVMRDLGGRLAYLFVALGFIGSVLTNIWSGGLSLNDVAPRLSRRAGQAIVAAVGAVIAAAGFSDLMLPWLTVMALAARG